MTWFVRNPPVNGDFMLSPVLLSNITDRQNNDQLMKRKLNFFLKKFVPLLNIFLKNKINKALNGVKRDKKGRKFKALIQK